MLQIATGMYFRQGVPLNETSHRAVFYTNSTRLHAETVNLPVGRFIFASGAEPITAVMVEVVDRLEAERPDGEPEFVVATGGNQLLDDAAAVFAFAANVTCARGTHLVERLIPTDIKTAPRDAPSKVLRRTFDPRVMLHDSDVEELRSFCTQLLALNRPYFDAAMRAIRRVVDATFLVTEDPSLAYTLFVAALESLALVATTPEEHRRWDSYNPNKRKLIDAPLQGLKPGQAEGVRNAILEADQLSLARRFQTFTRDHIRPSFYRSEAVGAIRPIGVHDLPHALGVAYRLRSRNVHELKVLAPELRLLSDRSETLRLDDRRVLSLEGLNRLTRHVIRTFVERSPTDLDASFDYRAHLPGVVQVPLAPQYWIWRADGFTAVTAPSVLQGLLEILLSEDPSKQLPDMTAVLERIESLASTTRKVEHRQPMAAIYRLWHLLLAPQHQRPNAEAFIDGFASDLAQPSVIGFAVRVLTGRPIEWSTPDLMDLIDHRRGQLLRGRQPLPRRLDTGLLLETAARLWDEGNPDRARALIAESVERLPGDEALIRLEELVVSGKLPRFELLDFVRGDWTPEPDASTDAE